MTLDVAVFERIGIRVTPSELEALIQAALARIVPSRISASPTHELTVDETAALVRGGMNPSWRSEDSTNPVVRTAADYAALLASSLTVDQAAKFLGIDASRVRHRLADRVLYGVREKSGWRIPAFQFSHSGLVPGIDGVMPRLPTTLHPLAVVGWFTRPNRSLHDDVDQTPVSPLDWLRTGREIGRVTQLAIDVGPGG